MKLRGAYARRSIQQLKIRLYSYENETVQIQRNSQHTNEKSRNGEINIMEK
jgi:hypothetical protein